MGVRGREWDVRGREWNVRVWYERRRESVGVIEGERVWWERESVGRERVGCVREIEIGV